MAKQNQVIDLSSENISYEKEALKYKVLRFFPQKQILEVAPILNGKIQKSETIAFAHIPRKIKQKIKPIS